MKDVHVHEFVIETNLQTIGKGIAGDPIRTVRSFWTRKGDLLATDEPIVFTEPKTTAPDNSEKVKELEDLVMKFGNGLQEAKKEHAYAKAQAERSFKRAEAEEARNKNLQERLETTAKELKKTMVDFIIIERSCELLIENMIVTTEQLIEAKTKATNLYYDNKLKKEAGDVVK